MGDKFVLHDRILSRTYPATPRSHIRGQNCSFLYSEWIWCQKTFGCVIGASHFANFSWGQICSPGDKFVPQERILSPDLPVIPRSHINERNCSFLSSQWICSPKIMNLGSILCSGGQNLSPGGQNLSPGFLIENQLIRSPNCISEASVIKTITNNGNFRIFFGHANFQIFD